MGFNWAKSEATSVFLQHSSLVLVGSVGLYLAFGNAAKTLQNGNSDKKSVDSCNSAACATVLHRWYPFFKHKTFRLHLFFYSFHSNQKLSWQQLNGLVHHFLLCENNPQWPESFQGQIHLCLLQVMADFLHERSIVSSLDRKFFVFKVERSTAWITLPIHCTIWHHINTSLDESRSNHFVIIRFYISVIE